MPTSGRHGAGCIVLLSVLISLAAGDLLLHGALGRWVLGVDTLADVERAKTLLGVSQP